MLKHQVFFHYHCYVKKKKNPPVVKSQEVHLVTGDHVGGLSTALGNKKTLYVRHLFIRLCNCWPFNPCVSHVRLRARRTSIYARALAVCWCHEAAYHRKSETSSLWPFVWVNKTSRAHSSGFDRRRHKYSWLCHEKNNKKSTQMITSTG